MTKNPVLVLNQAESGCLMCATVTIKMETTDIQIQTQDCVHIAISATQAVKS